MSAAGERIRQAWRALSELAWVSYEGDPYYAEHEGLNVDAIRSKAASFDADLARLERVVEAARSYSSVRARKYGPAYQNLRRTLRALDEGEA